VDRLVAGSSAASSFRYGKLTGVLQAKGVTKRYKDRVVFERINFAVGPGEVVAVVGENGAGKSTLLKLLAGLMKPDEGRIIRDGTVGYCPQDPGVFARLSVDEHLRAFGAGLGFSATESVRIGRKHLTALGMAPGEAGRSANLSGGTRQKLNLAIALLGDPDTLLLDEPYQGFDHGTYVNFWDLVNGWANKGKGVVIITHLLAELERADRVVDLGALKRVPA
jgi:ABC-2 type transport system ATP-binding protein